MTKRRAETTLLWEVPQKKCFRSLSNTAAQLAVESGVQNANAPPSFTTLTERTGQRRRKRPDCSEDHESKDIPSSQKKVPSNIRSDSLEATKNDSNSGRFQGASRIQQPCQHELASKRSKKDTQTKSEHRTKLMHNDDDDVGDSDLCAFNSFQFWRTPLPELDLSLLESQSTSETNGNTSLKDLTEAMET